MRKTMTSSSKRRDNASLIFALREFLCDFAHYAGYKGIVAAVLVGLGAILEALSLAVIVPLLSTAIDSSIVSGKFGRAITAAFNILGLKQPGSRLALLLGLFAVIMVTRAIILSFRDVRVAELQAGFVEALRLRIAERLTNAEWDHIVRLRHARVTHLMSGDIQRIGGITQLLSRSVVLGTMLLAQLGLVFLLAPSFAVSASIFLVVGIFLFIPFARRAHLIGGLMANKNLLLLDSTTQFLSGLKLSMSQNLQTRFITEFRQSLHELKHRQVEYDRQQSHVRNALSILAAVGAALLVLIGFTLFHLEAATLIALVVIIARMITPLGQIQQDAQHVIHNLPSYEGVRQIEREFAAVPEKKFDDDSTVLFAAGPISLVHVSYRYISAHDDKPAGGIEDVNLTIQAGEFLGVTGPSGSGKTTFADVLVGLCSPQKGKIEVAGTELTGPARQSWRDQVSYVSQDPVLFHDTVRRNITWANPQVGDKELWRALAFVGADKLVREMPLGLDTVVGERGSLVSGGERQRIALARGILRQPRLLVLDEATSAIDISGEREILLKLRELSNRPAIVIIAHRVESLAFCNRVLRFEAGRCVASSS